MADTSTEYGATEHGYIAEPEDAILIDLFELAGSLMGANIDTSEKSVLGSFIRIVAHRMAIYEQTIGKVWDSWFYDTATGVNLDKVVALLGLTRNKAQPAYVTLSFTGKPDTVIDPDEMFETEDGQIFMLEDTLILDADGNGSGTAVSMDESADANVAAETITKQTMPVEDITSVTNPIAATGGMVTEDDEAFRKRVEIFEKSLSGATQDGIKSSVANVAGVDQVGSTSTTPMKLMLMMIRLSLFVYAAGGIDGDVAQAISDVLAGGTQTVGSTVCRILDRGGHPQEIHFDRPTRVPLFMSITLDIDSTLFESDGVDQIKDNIKTYLNSLTMGDKVRFTYLYTLVYSVTGVTDADKIGRSKETLTAADIQLATFEAVAYEDGDIEVVTNAD
ncbi:baseplate J/gp47 family protein [Levilactobacillus brevis]|uniref:baseplate J/gp47 family protein n=1 Tax=Levilactobacillus brevis TaxID=1580 RepID=UPI0009BF1818|nr:baseplate J/gp47 family protein [Levilactobacillus brevis]